MPELPENTRNFIIMVMMILLTVVGTLLLRADNQQLETLRDHEQRLKTVERLSEKNELILSRIEKKIDKLLE